MPVARVVMSTSLSSRPSPRVYGAPWRLHSGKGLSPRSGRFGVDDGDGAAGYAGRLVVLVRYVDLPRLAHAPQVSRDAECHRPLRRELRELRTEVARDAFVVPYRVFQVQTLYFLAAPTDPRILAHRPGRERLQGLLHREVHHLDAVLNHDVAPHDAETVPLEERTGRD